MPADSRCLLWCVTQPNPCHRISPGKNEAQVKSQSRWTHRSQKQAMGGVCRKALHSRPQGVRITGNAVAGDLGREGFGHDTVSMSEDFVAGAQRFFRARPGTVGPVRLLVANAVLVENRSFRQKAHHESFDHPQMCLGPFFSHTNAGMTGNGPSTSHLSCMTPLLYLSSTAGIKNDSHHLAAVSASPGTPLLRLRVDHGDYLAVRSFRVRIFFWKSGSSTLGLGTKRSSFVILTSKGLAISRA